MSELGMVTLLIGYVYLASFFMLSAVAARSAGRSVWLLNRPGRGQRATSILFRVSFALAILWPTLRLWRQEFHLADIGAPLQGFVTAFIGHVFVAAGALFALMSQYHMGASWRVGAAEGEQGAFVQDGPFAYSRNPVFVGQIFLQVGLALAFPSWIQGAAAVLGLIAIVWQVRIEEPVLRASFGSDYDNYAARVPRWIGRVGSLAPHNISPAEPSQRA